MMSSCWSNATGLDHMVVERRRGPHHHPHSKTEPKFVSVPHTLCSLLGVPKINWTLFNWNNFLHMDIIFALTDTAEKFHLSMNAYGLEKSGLA